MNSHSYYKDLFTNFKEDKLKDLNKYREQSKKDFLKTGLPSQKNDSWRYSRVRELNATPLSYETSLHEVEGDNELIKQNMIALNSVEFIKTINIFNSVEQSPISALNSAMINDVIFIVVKNNNKPLIKLNYGSKGSKDKNKIAVNSSRVVIKIEENCEATIFENLVGNNNSLLTSVTDIVLEKGARLNYCKTTNSPNLLDNSFYLGSTRIHQAANSNLSSFFKFSGGSHAREEINAQMVEEHAETDLRGCFHAKDKELFEYHIDVNHRASNTKSRQFFKAIAQDTSRGVFCGSINVDEGLAKVDSQQLSQNLLLGNKSDINVKPQLNINSDDVKCSHGAAIGQMREDEIFYFESRGIPREIAKNILNEAFCAEVLLGITNKDFSLLLQKHLKKGDYSREHI